ADLVVERLPVASEDVGAGDDDVDLLGASGDGGTNLLDALLEGAESCREPGRNGGDGDPRTLEGLDGGFDVGVVDADRCGRDAGVRDAPGVQQVGAHRVAGLRAEAADVSWRTITSARGQVDTGDGAEEPGGLPLLLH